MGRLGVTHYVAALIANCRLKFMFAGILCMNIHCADFREGLRLHELQDDVTSVPNALK